jgi:iron(III) transport system ATP-binding protein
MPQKQLSINTNTERSVPVLSVQQLSITLGRQQVLNNVSFDIFPGEMVAILGPSGSGKTTLLNAIAGFIGPGAGNIQLFGETVSQRGNVRAPEQRHLGMVFQSYALWSHMSVLENVVFPLRQQGKGKAEAREQAMEMLSRLGLDKQSERYPSELSGGQQQRVGLARALASRPRLFLFDEPTANLDTVLKASFAQEIRLQQRESQVAGLYVTHDVQEALAIADRIIVLQEGQISQQGSPIEIYEHPVSREIAALSGLYSCLNGRLLARRNATGDVLIGGTTFSVALSLPAGEEAANWDGEIEVTCLFRPEWGNIISQRGQGQKGLAASVVRIAYQGTFTRYELELINGERVYVSEVGRPGYQEGEHVMWRPDRLNVLSIM